MHIYPHYISQKSVKKPQVITRQAVIYTDEKKSILVNAQSIQPELYIIRVLTGFKWMETRESLRIMPCNTVHINHLYIVYYYLFIISRARYFFIINSKTPVLYYTNNLAHQTLYSVTPEEQVAYIIGNSVSKVFTQQLSFQCFREAYIPRSIKKKRYNIFKYLYEKINSNVNLQLNKMESPMFLLSLLLDSKLFPLIDSTQTHHLLTFYQNVLVIQGISFISLF